MLFRGFTPSVGMIIPNVWKNNSHVPVTTKQPNIFKYIQLTIQGGSEPVVRSQLSSGDVAVVLALQLWMDRPLRETPTAGWLVLEPTPLKHRKVNSDDEIPN